MGVCVQICYYSFKNVFVNIYAGRYIHINMYVYMELYVLCAYTFNMLYINMFLYMF